MSLSLNLKLNLKSLPIYPELGEEQIEETVKSISMFGRVITS